MKLKVSSLLMPLLQHIPNGSEPLRVHVGTRRTVSLHCGFPPVQSCRLNRNVWRWHDAQEQDRVLPKSVIRIITRTCRDREPTDEFQRKDTGNVSLRVNIKKLSPLDGLGETEILYVKFLPLRGGGRRTTRKGEGGGNARERRGR